MSTAELERIVIERRLRVPAKPARRGHSDAIARQLDAALVSAGFKASLDLIRHVEAMDRPTAVETSRTVLDAVRRIVGDHVPHNVYFRDFPQGVPDTVEFWRTCILDALSHEPAADTVREQLRRGFVNLLSLPKYGRYQHSYQEMLAAHEDLEPALSTKLTNDWPWRSSRRGSGGSLPRACR